MNDEKDLIHFPLRMTNSDDLYLIKIDKKYSARLGESIDSLTVKSKMHNQGKTFFHIKVNDDGHSEIKGTWTEIHLFTHPADFYFSIEPEIKDYYYNLYNNIVYKNPDECSNYFMENIDIFKDAPLYPPPEFSSVSIRPIPKEIKVSEYKNDIRAIIFNCEEGEKIPDSPDPAYHAQLLNKYPKEYEIIMNHLKKAFDKCPVMSSENIRKEYKIFREEYDATQRENAQKIANLKIEKAKSENGIKNVDMGIEEAVCQYNALTGISCAFFAMFVPLVAYNIKSGPFLMCWVKFGTDLSTDSNNYKYQRLSKYKMGQNSSNNVVFIYEDEDLIKFIEQNKDKYISKNFDPKLGFFKKRILKYLRKWFKNKTIGGIVDHECEKSDSEFELL